MALDQLANTLLGGWADETLSSRAWRMRNSSKVWGFARWGIDVIFFWDEYHCYESHVSERERAQLPPELR